MKTNSLLNTSKVSALFLGIFLLSVGCAGIAENTNATASAVPTVDAADLKANTEVVNTVFNGTRENIDIIVIRPDL
jgi:sensor domain CHASE-containing protein